MVKIAVAGGTGNCGRSVVAAAKAAGHEVVILSRSTGVNLLTGEGLDNALTGVDGVIDVSNTAVWGREESETFFGTVAQTLVAACARNNIKHLVVLGIVGTHEVDLGYYYGKRKQEEIIAEGKVPWTILRATQFFDFAEQSINQAGMTELDKVKVTPMLCQPVATEDVAERLVQLVSGPPQGLTTPIAGPEKITLTEMVDRLLKKQGKQNQIQIVDVDVGPPVNKQLLSGALCPSGEHVKGKRTYNEYLAQSTAVPGARDQ